MSSKFIIEGGQTLRGEVQISGSKNAALPILASTLLTTEPVTISNIPAIQDVKVLGEIIESLGGKVEWLSDTQVRVDNSGVDGREPDYKKIKKLRASILILGPLLARLGRVRTSQPGGCYIGPRPIDVHLDGLKALGAIITPDGEFYDIRADDGLVGTKIVLNEMSVTGTSNILMAAVLAKGKTEIRLAAAEPENNNLAESLVKMGAKISGIGTHTLTIEGVDNLHSAKLEIIPDRLEAGTFAIAAALTHGEVTIKGYVRDHLDLFTNKLLETGVRMNFISDDTVQILKTSGLRAVDIKTQTYPGFPTDLQAPFGTLLTQAVGTSKIYETMYDGRLNYFKELAKMGATANILDPHRAVVSGPTVLYGKEIESLDIRAGATLILAALAANGKSIIDKVELIDRGYVQIEKKLQKLGAKIERVEEKESVAA
ncbi:UDP-N-acetylglucosamine 1-carboxyvinyltransferase [candidate division Kazan bacterium]|uniref:UDP-N-acetylglucosamine 1-carboxyvinyltransferase n=1 Tax=candidate division Kazan bacterium TaxID=2202143 RepID=A0A420ZDT5_UNCK3|nr:MAG: UDP-N-acetylglucosamine 1-carboxyvinyltransferase [candidate division Kazan bacterium]